MSDELQPEVKGPASWWSVPSAAYIGGQYISGGMVWQECEPITMEQYKESIEFYSQPWAAGATPMPGTPPSEQHYDKLSMVGRYHKKYNSFFYAVDGKRDPDGGLGSKTYEMQHVGGYYPDNLKVSLHETVWFYRGSEYVKEVTPRGYHLADNGANYEGPRPGSEAEALLGDGTYSWDEEEELYIIVPK